MSGIRTPGEIEINAIDIYATDDFAGPPVSLVDIMLDMHIFEDSQRSFMYGHITCQDSAGLFTKLPILGEETIYIKVATPGQEASVELEAFVYKVTNKQRQGTNSLVYTLHFISKEYMTGIQTPVSRAYKNKTSNEIVTMFYDEYMKYDKWFVRGEKLIDVEETLDPQWVVFPFWTPEACMNYLASRSVSKEFVEGEPMIFYEDRDGFHFTTMRRRIWEFGVTPNDVGRQEQLFYQQQVGGPGDTEAPARQGLRMMEFRVVSSTNTADRILNGFYKNKTINIDWERHKVTELDYHITQDYDIHKRVSEEQFAFNTKTWMESIHRDAHIRMINSRWNQKEDPGIAGKTDELYDFDTFSHLAKRVHREYMGIVAEATVYGNSVRQLFDVVNLTMFEPDATAETQDKYLSGKYYINAIHHIITTKEWVQTLEIVKDTLQRPLERV